MFSQCCSYEKENQSCHWECFAGGRRVSLVWGEGGGVGRAQLAHRWHQDVFLLLVKAHFSARQPGVLQLPLRQSQLLSDGPRHALLTVHPVGGHLSAHVVVQSAVGIVSQDLLQRSEEKQLPREKLNFTVVLFINTPAYPTCSPKRRIRICVIVEEFPSVFSSVFKWLIYRVKDAALLNQLMGVLCGTSQHLSGTLAFSHGFQTPVPVQQLEHGHQLLHTETHISLSSSTHTELVPKKQMNSSKG